MTDIGECKYCKKILREGKDSYVYLGFTERQSPFWGIAPVPGDMFCDATCLRKFLDEWGQD